MEIEHGLDFIYVLSSIGSFILSLPIDFKLYGDTFYSETSILNQSQADFYYIFLLLFQYHIIFAMIFKRKKSHSQSQSSNEVSLLWLCKSNDNFWTDTPNTYWLCVHLTEFIVIKINKQIKMNELIPIKSTIFRQIWPNMLTSGIQKFIFSN